MTRAFVFPGQGSQSIGMGKEISEAFTSAKEVFQEIDDILNQNLSRLIFNGEIEELTLTENAQPALMAVSLATIRALEGEANKKLSDMAVMVAGHSLGEYSALAAANAITISDAAKLLKLRGLSMQKAMPVGEGAMAAILGLSLEDATDVAAEAAGDDICAAANDNANGQVVLSGDSAAIERAIIIAKEKGAKRALMLSVSAPFHCALMQPAADAMREALRKIDISAPDVPIIANVTAEAINDPNQIRGLLVKQVCNMVRWRESVLYMKSQNIDHLVEIGAGKVLSGLTKRIDKEISSVAINNPADIENFLNNL